MPPASSYVLELFVDRLMSGRTGIFLRVKDIYPVLDIMSVLVLFLKTLTLRLLMSYICGAPILDVSGLHTTTQHSR